MFFVGVSNEPQTEITAVTNGEEITILEKSTGGIVRVSDFITLNRDDVVTCYSVSEDSWHNVSWWYLVAATD